MDEYHSSGNQDSMLAVVAASHHAFLKMPQNVELDTTVPGKVVISSSHAFMYAVSKGPKTVRSHSCSQFDVWAGSSIM